MATGWLVIAGLFSISAVTNALVYLKTGRVPSLIATIVGAVAAMLIFILNH